METTILKLHHYGVAFGEQTVLADISLSIPHRGVTVLIGPVSTGKSTLLRSLAGYNDAQPAFRSWGEALYAGDPLGKLDRPALVSQNARLMLDSVFENMASALPERHLLTRTQQQDLITRLLSRSGLESLCDRLTEEVIQLPLGIQRRLAIARTIAPNPHLLLLDEPTAGLKDEEVEAILQQIASEAERRAVLMITHNQMHAQSVASHVALIVAGQIREFTTSKQFFSKPSTEVGRQFVRTGSCSLPPVDEIDEENVNEEQVQEQEKQQVQQDQKQEQNTPAPLRTVVPKVTPSGCGPRGFRWLKPGQLAGTPRPGIVSEVDYDLESLRRVGVNVLVTLEEESFDPVLLKQYDIESYHLPIADMHAPTVSQTIDLCKRIEAWNKEGVTVAVHCRAGLGRTGTQLACQLIWDGKTPIDALDRVRQIEPRWVQSEVQVNHLKELHTNLKASKTRGR